MLEKLIKALTRYKDIIAYGVFGVLTTAVNVVSYWLCSSVLGMQTVPSSVIAWIASVAFAYVTNRRWVFHSEAEGVAAIAREVVAFFASRLATGIVDWVGMWLCVDVLSFPGVPTKIVVNCVVIVLNFVASKLLVFRSHAD